MKYMMLIKHSESFRGMPIPQGLMDAMGTFVQESFANGTLKDTAGLKPTADAFKIRQDGRKLAKIDGPFTESKEVVGGYAIVEVNSHQDAIDVATKFMDIHLVHWPEFVGECEVRPCEDM